MPAASVLTLSSPIPGLIAFALALTALSIAKLRKIALPIQSQWHLALGILLLSLAAAGPVWNLPHPGTIAVMIDLSPSTRGASFRNPHFVQQRLSELIGNAP